MRKLLAHEIDKAGGLRPFCREHGDLDPSYVQRVVNGAKLSPAILAAIGVELIDTVSTYRRRKMKPWYTTPKDPNFSGGLVRCTRCNEPLTGHAIRMLELDQRTQTYHDLGDVPEDRSQGWFPFGLKCAKREISEHQHKAS